MDIDIRMSSRALREVFLRPFQMAPRESNPRLVMSSHNRVNGPHVSESSFLLDQVLGKEWGFDGLAISDWYVLRTLMQWPFSKEPKL